MPFEKGGRADKQGNRYEIHCIIYEILKILNETNYSVVIEAHRQIPAKRLRFAWN